MRYTTVALAALLLTTACAGETEVPADEATLEASAETAAELPATIVAERGGFVPEGIEYDNANGRILTGSVAEGTVYQIHADGRVTPVVTDPELISSVGIEVDEDRNRLLVANADRGAFEGTSQGQAKLGVYDLTSGDRLAMVELASSIPNRPADATHFANDVTVDDVGTAYVTDTMQNAIYRVSPDYMASLFYRFEGDESLGLNGLVYHPSGYLLVGAGATLYKIPVDDPAAHSEVALPEEIAGQDGLVWTADGRLVITSNSQSRVVALSSDDDWATARLAGVGSFPGQGTTAAVVGDDVYVVHPQFAGDDPPVVRRVDLR